MPGLLGRKEFAAIKNQDVGAFETVKALTCLGLIEAQNDGAFLGYSRI